MSFVHESNCRACGSELEIVFDLGSFYPSAFLDGDPTPFTEKAPLVLARCKSCQLVQLKHTVDLDLLYRNYFYRSSLNQSMQKALFDVARSAMLNARLTAGDIVVDIACFPEATIITSEGCPKNISEIEEGDLICDDSGDFTKVVSTMHRLYDGELIKIRIAHGSSDVRMTPDHPVLAVKKLENPILPQSKRLNQLKNKKPIWIQADCLEIGDYVVLPKSKNGNENYSIDLSNHLDCFYDEAEIFAKQLYHGSVVKAHNQRPLPRFMETNHHFGRFLGLYLAEGSGRSNKFGSISFALHKNEIEYIEFLQNFLSNEFNIPSSIEKNSGESVSIRANNMQLKQLLQSWFGHNAREKRIPRWFLNQNQNFLSGFLRGYFEGDGSFVNETVKFDTVSKVLAYQIRQLLYRFDVTPTIVPNKPNGFGKKNGKTLYSVRVFGKDAIDLISLLNVNENNVEKVKTNYRSPRFENYQLLRINNIEREFFKGTVYNLETESNTYIVDNFTVHNCNDGTLLSYYAPYDLKRVGFDPAQNFLEDAQRHCDVFINDYFTDSNYPYKQKAKIVTSIAMFYDLSDPCGFVQGVKSILHQDGIWILQLTDLTSMLKINAFDNICHEHLEYYTLNWLVEFLQMFSLDTFRVETNQVNGGSVRLYICHAENREIQNNVHDHLRSEKIYLDSFEDPLVSFKERIYETQIKVLSKLHHLIGDGKLVYGMAASTKGNTLLQAWNINNKLIPKIADVNPDKFGRRTIGTNIEIISDQQALQEKPDYFFILAWHFLSNFAEKYESYLESGGKFIVPLPEPRIYFFENGVLEWHLL